MSVYDVFNGDADGILALHQLRLAQPLPQARLITGVKRDIRLLERLDGVAGSQVTVLDVSLEANREPLEGLLARGCRVVYFDHHHAGQIPQHAGLEPHIDLSPAVCTSLLVNRHLKGAHLVWAVAAAFGDNLDQAARQAAQPLGLTEAKLAALKTLGELVNYNGYGDTTADLHFHPEALYRAIAPFDSPFDFIAQSAELARLAQGYAADMAQAQGREAVLEAPWGWVFRFPGQAWARRVMGAWANQQASQWPERAMALLVENDDGTLKVSVRAPQNRPRGADTLCLAFHSGGGRAGAAGINRLEPGELPRFLAAFQAAFEA